MGERLLIGPLYLNAPMVPPISLPRASAFLPSPTIKSASHCTSCLAQGFLTTPFTVIQFSPQISFLIRCERRTSYLAYSASCTTHSSPIHPQWRHNQPSSHPQYSRIPSSPSSLPNKFPKSQRLRFSSPTHRLLSLPALASLSST